MRSSFLPKCQPKIIRKFIRILNLTDFYKKQEFCVIILVYQKNYEWKIYFHNEKF